MFSQFFKSKKEKYDEYIDVYNKLITALEKLGKNQQQSTYQCCCLFDLYIEAAQTVVEGEKINIRLLTDANQILLEFSDQPQQKRKSVANYLINTIKSFHQTYIENNDPKNTKPELSLWEQAEMLCIKAYPSITNIASTPTNTELSSINSLPDDIIFYIAIHLPLQNMKYLPCVSKRFYQLFQFENPERNQDKQRLCLYDTKKLLHAVMIANPNAVQHQFKNGLHSQCLLEKVPAKELCERTWNAISPLEFAAWAGDTFMLVILLTHLLPEKREEALVQLVNVQTSGLEGRCKMEPFKNLINAYSKAREMWETINPSYIFNKHRTNDLANNRTEASHNVGKAQYQLPFFGLQWLCETYDTEYMTDQQPTYNRPPSRTLILENELWKTPYLQPGLGSTFGIIKWVTITDLSNYACVKGHIDQMLYPHLPDQQNEMQEVCIASERHLNEIIENLRQQIAEDKTQQFVIR